MDSRDVVQQGNMAEAAVESPAARFFCHKCSLEISPVLPDYTCPRCQGGFIEEVAQPSTEPSEESDDDIYGHGADSNEDADALNQVADLWNMLTYIRRPDDPPVNFMQSTSGNSSQDAREGRYMSRPGPSRRNRYIRVPNRRPNQDLETARTRTEGFLQQLVNTLSENTDDLPRHSRDDVVSTIMPVIKQRDTNDNCAKTLAFIENKLAEDANTSFIEQKSVKGRSPPKQGVQCGNGDLLPTKATQIKKTKENHFFNN
ncbi:hypothetical protein AVEN_60571-1 [Araneus ventricosus]|uniref:RING-type E3 ubiquitin transferase n=1 Tax=Araneus ventricosus TaxID=182803 RepID=A0A4Y2F136_ARAVE|nr:hypothetical protein AVEN_60571-1 [Araneus ventricosus]